MQKTFQARLLIWPLACTLLGTPLPMFAAERSNATHAVALIEKAQEYVAKNGVEASITEFNRLDSPFNVTSPLNPNGDLYMFMFSANKGGVQLVHGKNPKIVNKDVIDMRDNDGVYLIREIIKTCNNKDGKGWVAYKWPNPVTKMVEDKLSYIVKMGEVCLGTGIYKQ